MASVLPRQVHSLHLSFPPPYSPMSIPPQVGPHPTLSIADQKRSASTALAGTHLAISAEACAGWTIPKAHGYYFTYATTFGFPNHLGMATSTMQTVTSCIIDTVSRCFSGTQAQHAGTPPRLLRRLCGRFHAVILQEASDHVPQVSDQVSDQFISYTSDTDLVILLNRDTSEPNAAVFAFHGASTSKDTWRYGSSRGSWTLATPFPSSAPPRSRVAPSTPTML